MAICALESWVSLALSDITLPDWSILQTAAPKCPSHWKLRTESTGLSGRHLESPVIEVVAETRAPKSWTHSILFLLRYCLVFSCTSTERALVYFPELFSFGADNGSWTHKSCSLRFLIFAPVWVIASGWNPSLCTISTASSEMFSLCWPYWVSKATAAFFFRTK